MIEKISVSDVLTIAGLVGAVAALRLCVLRARRLRWWPHPRITGWTICKKG